MCNRGSIVIGVSHIDDRDILKIMEIVYIILEEWSVQRPAAPFHRLGYVPNCSYSKGDDGYKSWMHASHCISFYMWRSYIVYGCTTKPRHDLVAFEANMVFSRIFL